MKRRFLTVLAATTVFAMIGVAAAIAVGVPEIDRANATFSVKPTATPVILVCPGEDATTYVKDTGTWKGGEVDFTPGSTDYVLTGKLSFTGAVWTINTTTGRGLFTAKAKLVSAAGVPLYSGTITLITQDAGAGTSIAKARGWLIAKTYGGDPPNPPGVPDGGSLLANVVATIATTGSFAISGQFGDAPPSPGTLDYSVTTINQTC
jgi:hypothetical protein